MSSIRAVGRFDNPLVASGDNIFGTRHHHWFDGQRHPGLEGDPSSGLTVVRYLGRFVQILPYTVSRIVPDNTITALQHAAFHRVSDIAERSAGLRNEKRFFKTFLVTERSFSLTGLTLPTG